MAIVVRIVIVAVVLAIVGLVVFRIRSMEEEVEVG